MPAITPKFGDGPYTFPVVETVLGGQLVEGRSGGVGVAAAGSVVVIGVAEYDGNPAGTGAYAAGPPATLQAFGVATKVAVARDCVAPLTYAASATFGQPVVAAANGQVTPAGATPDARTIVGRCLEPNGVASGAVGQTYIR